MGRSPGARASASRGARREALVRAAVELFSKHPYEDIYISDIAAAAGVAHGLLFYHFKDKRGLYLAALSQVMDEVSALHQSASDAGSPADRLRALIRRHLEYRRDHPMTMLAMMRTGRDPEIDRLYERSREATMTFIAELIGLPQPVSPRVRAAVRGCMGFIDEMTVDWLTHDCDIDLDELEELAFSATVGALSQVCTAEVDAAHLVDELRSGDGDSESARVSSASR
ncbi:TetR/AcrR family transcriptional regulator [Pseudonocardia thermophila]|jgi:Transcriptional regulator|uniref:TetR/AcrR family transcriptional regulator n=1 Tax=Pseudonocardia thermophila TaxID=1848 RepID=UPI00248EAA18|nr:TetR/AcrR family transcriptional regulator [Pseudonocardia thermophila]